MSIPPTGQNESEVSAVRQFRLRNQSGFEVILLNYGASIQSIKVPTPGGPVDVILGYADALDYLQSPCFMGSTLGRYANRIEDSQLKLEGRVYPLQETPNATGHCLHGGEEGFSQRFWQAGAGESDQSVRFTLVSDDGDQGFPGRVVISVSYSLLDDWTLAMDYHAITNAVTVISLANHAYFNLNGDDSPIDNHEVMINAEHFTPAKDNMIPSGEISNVAGTDFDFREPVRIADRIGAENKQLSIGQGFDHNFILTKRRGAIPPAAAVYSPQSGLELGLFTSQPAMQLYTGQHLDQPFQARGGLCLEAQAPPNAPNTPGFPNTVLRPGMTYKHRTVYRFSMKS